MYFIAYDTSVYELKSMSYTAKNMIMYLFQNPFSSLFYQINAFKNKDKEVQGQIYSHVQTMYCLQNTDILFSQPNLIQICSNVKA